MASSPASVNSPSGSALSISGLATGLNTSAIISALISAQKIPITHLTETQEKFQGNQSALQTIQTNLQQLAFSISEFNLPSIYESTATVTSSNPAVVAATGSVGAVGGGHEVEVTQLATAAQRSFKYTPPTAAGKISIDGKELEVKVGETAKELAASINADPTATVYAAALENGNIVLSDRATGASGAEFIKVSAPAGTLTEVSGSGHEGRNAEYKVDGIAGTSKSNVVTEAIGGVSLTLTGLTNGSAVTVDVQPPGSSVTAIEAQVQSFVKLYNSTITAIQKELSTKPPEHPSTAAEYGAGSLFGDLELGGLLNTMRQAMYEPIAGLPSTMASPSDIGISTGAASASTSSSTLEGQLTLDPAKLAEAVHNNPVEARKMLEAWSKNLQGIVENAARPGGSLETRAHSDSAQVRNLSEQIDNMNAMIATREKALVQTYARLEGILSQNSSQGTWLTSQSEALTKAGG